MTLLRSFRVEDIEFLVPLNKRRWLKGEVEDAVVGLSVEYGQEQVAELTVIVDDQQGRFSDSKLIGLGTRIEWPGNTVWQVGSVEAEYFSDTVRLTFRARSELAKRLRQRASLSAKKVAPSTWVAAQVKAAGGTSLVQKTSKGRAVTQDRSQTTLDVIGSLAGDLGWSWCEWDNTFLFGSPHNVWSRGDAPWDTALTPTWRAEWKGREGAELLSFRGSVTDDDRETFGSAEITVPQSHGVRYRPWHVVDVKGTGQRDHDGLWLVESVATSLDGAEPVSVRLGRPKKKAAQPVSASYTAGSGDGTGRAFLDIAMSKQGIKYDTNGTHTSYEECFVDNPEYLDCSDFTLHVAWLFLGKKRPPMPFVNQSWQQKAYCQQRGRIITAQEAARIPGALLFRTPNPTGHVGISLGNGSQYMGAHGTNILSGVSGITYGGSQGFDSGGLPDFVRYE